MSTSDFTHEDHHVVVNRSSQLIERELLEEAVGFSEFRHAMIEDSEEATTERSVGDSIAYPGLRACSQLAKPRLVFPPGRY